MSLYGAPGWVLAIDFGTSNTSASWRDASGQVRELRLGSGGNLMPSAVLVGPEKIVVGETATRTAQTNPAAFEPAPKRRLPEGTVLLGGRSVTSTSLVAAVFSEVLRLANRVAGHPPAEVVITHPDRWDEGLKGQLLQSAVEAGIPRDRIRLLTEARAAAWFYTGWGTPPAVGELISVFDFGAGTCDVAVLKKEHDGSFTLLAADGVDGLGGRDLDGRIWQWVRRELSGSNPEMLAELDSPAGLRSRLMLMDRIREAKETLSELSTAAIAVPGRDQDAVLTLTRDELERLIAADIAEAVALTHRVFTRTGRPDRLYLTGGSSLIPLVHAELGKVAPVAELGDPQTVVSQGALRAPGRRAQAEPRRAAAPPAGWAQAPAPAYAGPAQPGPIRQASTPPVPPHPVPSRPTSSHQAPSPSARPQPSPASVGGTGSGKKPWMVIGGLLGVVLLVGGGFGIKWAMDRSASDDGSSSGVSRAADAKPDTTSASPTTTGASVTTSTTATPASANCAALDEYECVTVSALTTTVLQKYTCESAADNLDFVEVSATTNAVFCGRKSSSDTTWPEIIAVYSAYNDADVQTIFSELHRNAVLEYPETEDWPNPTSTNDWTFDGEVQGDALSLHTDGYNAIAWTEEEWQGVVLVGDMDMSNQDLVDWFGRETIWA